MLGVLLAFALFANPVIMNETGKDYATEGFTKACEAIGGEYDAKAKVRVGGNGKEARDAPAYVPYCSAGFATLVDLIEDKVSE